MPFDLEDESDGTFILLLRGCSIIKYPLTRFLLAVSDQAGVSPWQLAHVLTEHTQVLFEQYYLPFYPGERIWVEYLDKNRQVVGNIKPVLRPSAVVVDYFWALNPVMSEEIAMDFRREAE